jgi:hypothetical protein
MKTPNLFIVGAPRSGTTSMYVHLKAHPEPFMSPIKEIGFFGSDLSIAERPSLEKYLSYFSDWGEERYGGEGSTVYLYSSQAAKEILEFSPSARILILLRNPVDFLHSLHRHIMNLGYEDITDFSAALDAEPARRSGGRIPKGARRAGMVELLRYRDVATFSIQVKRYLDVFPREHVHIVLFDDLRDRPAEVYRDTLRFLGVDPHFETSLAAANPNLRVRSRLLFSLLKRSWKDASVSRSLPTRVLRKLVLEPMGRFVVRPEARAPMPRELRRRLEAEFAPEVERLGDLLGRDLSRWCRPPDA